MKPSHILAAVAIAALGAGCNAEQGPGGPGGSSGPAETIAPPEGQSWEQVITRTAEGGYVMGNPNANVKLVEFASMTCPHCADFDDSVDELVNKYVKSGQVSFELRNYVRDPYDLTASLIVRCGGEGRFFPLTHAMFDSQDQWVQRLQSVPQDRMNAALNSGPQRQFVEVAQLAGFQEWAAQRGLPPAQTQACLTNQQEINQLVQMHSDANTQHNIPGTPTFLINGEVVENAASWEALEPKLREAVGG